jgi:ABC-type Mn2+/Zn2+ transport system ATPase subunit
MVYLWNNYEADDKKRKRRMKTFLYSIDPHRPHVPTAASVQLREVTATYAGITALDNLSFTLNQGDQVAVVGPNGAGKSTLFNLIARIIQPVRGQVNIYGSGPEGHICVGYVPQRNRLDWRFPVTVADVVMMGRVGKIGLFRWPRRQDRELVDQALARVGMQSLANRQIGELSGGQQQRVFLARALAQEAELLLLDEPLTGLDQPSQEAILDLLAQLREQRVTVLVATHDLNQAAEHFAKVMLLNRRLIALGTPQEVLTPNFLSLAYGNQLHVVHGAQGDLILADTCCGDGHEPHPVVAQPSKLATKPATKPVAATERMFS